MGNMSSELVVLLVSLLNNNPVDVNKYVNETIQVPSIKVGHSLESLEVIKKRDQQLHELSELVFGLTDEAQRLMHLIASVKIEDLQEDILRDSLKQLHDKTEEVIPIAEYRFQNTSGDVQKEHEKVLYFTTVLNTFVFALIDEDLQEITGFKRTVPADIFSTGKDLYAMDKRTHEMLA